MHNGALKKWALALTFWLALYVARLHAQLVSTVGTSPIQFGVDSNGLLFATGSYGTGSLSLSGSGSQMFWYPGKAAFRAGYAYNDLWDDANIGVFSAAFGEKTEASGWASSALGASTTASGGFSMATGINTTASGNYSTAMGYGSTASGRAATAIGWATASGAYSVAVGQGYATGEDSTAFGGGTATGGCSTAFGCFVTASGNYSTASGYYTTASAYASFVLGRYNVGGGTATSWVPTEALFEIGNGTGTALPPYRMLLWSTRTVIQKFTGRTMNCRTRHW